MKTKIMQKIKELKSHSASTYALAKNQYDLLEKTNTSIQEWKAFENDIIGALAVYK